MEVEKGTIPRNLGGQGDGSSGHVVVGEFAEDKIVCYVGSRMEGNR